jgi:hypothetical protein
MATHLRFGSGFMAIIIPFLEAGGPLYNSQDNPSMRDRAKGKIYGWGTLRGNSLCDRSRNARLS